MGYLAFNLTEKSREAVLEKFAPRYDNVICHHVTYKFGVPADAPLPPAPQCAQVVGYATDDAGVECLVVAIDGTEVRPLDGKTYHVTLSLAPGRKPVESNTVLAERGWIPLVEPFTIEVEPRWNK
jgi:hypothetical protein